jgi:hypothetical protein
MGKGRICARAGFKFQKMVVEGFALYFLIGMQFMIIATMSALKGTVSF